MEKKLNNKLIMTLDGIQYTIGMSNELFEKSGFYSNNDNFMRYAINYIRLIEFLKKNYHIPKKNKKGIPIKKFKTITDNGLNTYVLDVTGGLDLVDYYNTYQGVILNYKSIKVS